MTNQQNIMVEPSENAAITYDFAQTITAMARIPLIGHIVPQRWFKAIHSNGYADLTAIIVLAEIIDCYKPVADCDDIGQPFTYRPKFKGDMLQRSNDSLSRLLAIPESEIEKALTRLETAGYIVRVYRTIDTPLGLMNGVQYIFPVIDAIQRISAIGYIGD